MIRKYRIPLKAENGRLRPEHAYALYGETMDAVAVAGLALSALGVGLVSGRAPRRKD